MAGGATRAESARAGLAAVPIAAQIVVVADAAEDSSLVAALGAKVRVVPGDPANLHVTTPAELELARRLLAP